MKLIVMIPAYNEEETISKVIKEIPRQMEGIDKIEVLVINDGSKDHTVKVAAEAGADYIISQKGNQGLALTFRKGLEECLKKGADIIVNTDADFQYNQSQIPDIINPILKEQADIVLGSRFLGNIEYMPLQKRIGNIMATRITRAASGYPVTDAQTGFRAFTREAALKMNIMSNYTYVQETIIQATNHNLTIVEVPIEFRRRDGNSRLMSSAFNYATRAANTILRTYRDYEPMKVFGSISLLLFLISGYLVGRVLYKYFTENHVTPSITYTISIIILCITGLQVFVFGILADMLTSQRIRQEEILYRLKKIEME